jgi:hypothetical protein
MDIWTLSTLLFALQSSKLGAGLCVYASLILHASSHGRRPSVEDPLGRHRAVLANRRKVFEIATIISDLDRRKGRTHGIRSQGARV